LINSVRFFLFCRNTGTCHQQPYQITALRYCMRSNSSTGTALQSTGTFLSSSSWELRPHFSSVKAIWNVPRPRKSWRFWTVGLTGKPKSDYFTALRWVKIHLLMISNFDTRVITPTLHALSTNTTRRLHAFRVLKAPQSLWPVSYICVSDKFAFSNP